MHGKLRGSLALIETAKIDHIWSKLKEGKDFTLLDIISVYHHISIHPDSRLKTAFTCPYGKFQRKRVAFGVQMAPSVFLILMFKLFFKYLDGFLVFWMDHLLIYSQTEEEHLKHIQFSLHKIFEKLESNLKCLNVSFSKVKLNI